MWRTLFPQTFPPMRLKGILPMQNYSITRKDITSKRTSCAIIRTKSLYLKPMISVRNILTALLVSAFFLTGAAGAEPSLQPFNGKFQNISAGERPRGAVCSIAQDSIGFIYLGTDGGLVRYDGIRSQTFHREEGNPRSLCNEHVNALYYDTPTGTLWVGTNLGLCRYDGAGGFILDETVGWKHIKTIFRSGSSLWVGTTEGLFRLDDDSCGASGADSASDSKGTRARAEQRGGAQCCAPGSVCIGPGLHIAAGCALGDDLYFGSYGCLYRIRGGSSNLEKLPLNIPEGTQGNLVLALIPLDAALCSSSCLHGSEHISPEASRSLYVGSERGLFLYDTVSGKLTLVRKGAPVKNFIHLPDGTLLAGTDNGLLSIASDSSIQEIFRHDVRNSRSIPDNVIWSSFVDRDGNLWIGTDHGAAISPLRSDFSFASLDEPIPGGMDVTSMACSPDGALWTGGMSGLARRAEDGTVQLFRPGAENPRIRLSHNKVRALYADGENVWVASDGGLSRIDSGLSVSNYDITESSGTCLSDWMYCITEDSCGRLWMGTYDGGIFISSKNSLPNGGGKVTAEHHLGTSDGLSGNIVFRICTAGNKVVVVTDRGVDLVSTENFSVKRVAVPGGARTLSLESDGRRIWVGTEAGVYLLCSDGTLSSLSGSSVCAQSLIYNDECLWIADETELWRYSISSGEWALVRNFDNPLFSLAASADGGTIFAGSINGCYCLDESTSPLRADSQRVVVSELYLDNVLVKAQQEYSGREILSRDISLTSSVCLSSHQNSFALSFTSLKYPLHSGHFAYRLAGFHETWQICSPDSRAVFLNVPPGSYTFQVHHVGPDGEPDSETATLGIKILRPWYSNQWAVLTYIIVLAALALFVWYFFKVRSALKKERIERAKAEDRATSAVSRSQEFFETLSAMFTGKSPAPKDEGTAEGEAPVQESADPDARFMKVISEIVSRHLADPEFSAAALCEESRWPSKQVYRKIKQLTGLGPTEFIRDIRLQKAAALLSEGKLSVTEVMYKVGFTTPSYFSKCFKARYGVTPSEYRISEE